MNASIRRNANHCDI